MIQPMRSSQLLSKLKQIQICGSFAGHFKQTHRVNGGMLHTVERLSDLRIKVHLATELPVIGPLASEINESQPLQMLYEKVDIEPQTWMTLSSTANKIDVYIEAIIAVITAVSGGSPDENEVSIKIPSANQLGSVTESLSRIDRFLNQAMSILPESPSFTVRRWDNGSLWIDVLVSSVSGVILIGGLAWAAACAFKKYQEGRILEKMTESLGMKNELLGVIRDGVDKAVNEVIDAEARRLDAKHSKAKGEPESIQRLQFCIRELYEMVRSGTEIHPSLLAPEDVKNVFPNMEEILSLPSTQKLLTDQGEATAVGDNITQ